MDKILDGEFKDSLFSSLLEAGIEEKEVEKIVNKRYKVALKKAATNLLKTVIKLIEDDKYEAVEELISDSPSGDGYDNKYIDFSGVTGFEDIGEIIYRLKSLDEN